VTFLGDPSTPGGEKKRRQSRKITQALKRKLSGEEKTRRCVHGKSLLERVEESLLSGKKGCRSIFCAEKEGFFGGRRKQKQRRGGGGKIYKRKGGSFSPQKT